MHDLALATEATARLVAPGRIALVSRTATEIAGKRAHLDGRRLGVLHPEPGAADALAQTLRQRGAQVAVLSLDPARLERAEALDPEVIVVEPQHFTGECWEALASIFRHPQLRWTCALVSATEAIGSEGLQAHDLPALCAQVQLLCADYDAAVARARQAHEFDVALETLGPTRVLRLLAQSGKSWRAQFNTAGLSMEVDLAEGLIVGARGGYGRTLDDALLGTPGLNVLLREVTGFVRARPVERPAVTNIMAPLDTALAAAFHGRERGEAPSLAARDGAVPAGLPRPSASSLGGRGVASRTLIGVPAVALPPGALGAAPAKPSLPAVASLPPLARPSLAPMSGPEPAAKPSSSEREAALGGERSERRTLQGHEAFVSPPAKVEARASARERSDVEARAGAGERNDADRPEDVASLGVHDADSECAPVDARERSLAPAVHPASPSPSVPRPDTIQYSQPPSDPTTMASRLRSLRRAKPALGAALAALVAIAWLAAFARREAAPFAGDRAQAAAPAAPASRGAQTGTGPSALLAAPATQIGAAASPSTPAAARAPEPASEVARSPAEIRASDPSAVAARTKVADNAPSAPHADATTVRDAQPRSGAAARPSLRLEPRALVRRVNALAKQGKALLRRGLTERAKSAYDAALELAPNHPRALAGRLRLALSEKDAELALQHARALAQARPKSAMAQLLLGDAERLAGDLAAARAAWHHAARLGSPDARARLRRMRAP